MGVTACDQLAKALALSRDIYQVVREQRAISADLALRLGKYFGMTPQFWMNLQSDYDLASGLRRRSPEADQASSCSTLRSKIGSVKGSLWPHAFHNHRRHLRD